jgi:hypothetical protein
VVVQIGDSRVAGDLLQWDYASALMADKNVGAGKAVAVSGVVLGGADAANYRVVSNSAATTVNIAPRLLTAVMTADKVFDGSTAAIVSFSDNRVTGDVLGVSAAQADFADRNAGMGKWVTATGVAISGADAGNYRLGASTLSSRANVAPASLTVALLDATAVATGQPYVGGAGFALLGLQGSDTVATLQGTPVYGGTAQGAVNVGTYSLTLTGLSAANYVLNVAPASLSLVAQVDTSRLARGVSLAGQGGSGTGDAAGAGTGGSGAGMPLGALQRTGAGAGAWATGNLGSLVTNLSAAPAAAVEPALVAPNAPSALTANVSSVAATPAAQAAAASATSAPGATAAPMATSADRGDGAVLAVYRSEMGLLQPQAVLKLGAVDGQVQATPSNRPAPVLAGISSQASRHGLVVLEQGTAALPLSLSRDGVLLVTMPDGMALPKDTANWAAGLLNAVAAQLGWAPEQVRAIVMR